MYITAFVDIHIYIYISNVYNIYIYIYRYRYIYIYRYIQNTYWDPCTVLRDRLESLRLRALDAELKSKFGVGPLPQQTEG